ncbi:hypothetical protein L4Z68_001456 [Pseudomonas aeruginosa]|nr:hypothetical protein [Pseudomonas aeruginosa]EKX2969462.1 hypothetical protein [Pseudomonas aeruginosa]HBO8004147.1 hypothetical protein [Pseudomonas aeruginosa]
MKKTLRQCRKLRKTDGWRIASRMKMRRNRRNEGLLISKRHDDRQKMMQTDRKFTL